MRAGSHNLTVDQGTDWAETFTLRSKATGEPIDLTGYAARMQVRRDYDASAVMVELTTANGRIVLGGEDGTIALSLTASTTAGITRSGVYDIELVSPGGLVSRPLRGDFVLRREVTR